MAIEISWDKRAACATLGGLTWGLVERSVEECLISYTGRTKRRRAYHMAMPALQICQTCPVSRECLLWATENKYSGIAGRQVLINGRPLLPLKKKEPS